MLANILDYNLMNSVIEEILHSVVEWEVIAIEKVISRSEQKLMKSAFRYA